MGDNIFYIKINSESYSYIYNRYGYAEDYNTSKSIHKSPYFKVNLNTNKYTTSTDIGIDSEDIISIEDFITMNIMRDRNKLIEEILN